MSSNGDTNVVLRGVTHGAVDFLIKPVRVEELRNVWQHVVRRRSLHLSRATDEHSGLDSEHVRWLGGWGWGRCSGCVSKFRRHGLYVWGSGCVGWSSALAASRSRSRRHHAGPRLTA